MDTLYILTRTSGRKNFFQRARASVEALAYPGKVVHIVHTDDPRDDYVRGDIILRGEVHGPYMGSGPYNLYNNRLLEAIPSPGWVAFLDDDDEYIEPDIFNFLAEADKEKIHVMKVRRWEGKIFPAKWKHQTTFQTECFVCWSDIAKKGKWWSEKGGDHYYTRQLTRGRKIEWHDKIVCQCQEGKGHGRRIDQESEVPDYSGSFPKDKEVYLKMFVSKNGRQGGKLETMAYSEALVFEKHGFGRVSYKGVKSV